MRLRSVRSRKLIGNIRINVFYATLVISYIHYSGISHLKYNLPMGTCINALLPHVHTTVSVCAFSTFMAKPLNFDDTEYRKLLWGDMLSEAVAAKESIKA